MALVIKQASKAKKKLRMMITGQTAAGKTFGALTIAQGLAENPKILLFDTEKGRAGLKSDKFDFDVIEWSDKEQGRPVCCTDYMDVIKIAEDSGYDVLIFDSTTPEWEQIKDRHSKMAGNSFSNWGKVKIDHHKFVNRLLDSSVHIICTARSKMDYILEETTNSYGKTVQAPKLVGLGTQQESDLPYFMDFVFNIKDREHNCEAEKDETNIYLNKGHFIINETTGKNILNWLNSEVAANKEPVKVDTDDQYRQYAEEETKVPEQSQKEPKTPKKPKSEKPVDLDKVEQKVDEDLGKLLSKRVKEAGISSVEDWKLFCQTYGITKDPSTFQLYLDETEKLTTLVKDFMQAKSC